MVAEKLALNRPRPYALYPRVGYDVVTRGAVESAKDFWLRVAAMCPRLTDEAAVKFFAPHLRSVACVIIEQDYVCKDHRNVFRHFYAKKFLRIDSLTSRLHLFEKRYDDIRGLIAAANPSDGYLGFSVIRSVESSCVGRTVISPRCWSWAPQRVFSLTTRFRVHLAGCHLNVEGYPFMAQDGESTVCSHVALWGMCRYLSERYPTYREVYPFDLVKMADPRNGRSSPYGGLTFQDFSHVFSNFGCHPLIDLLREPKEKGGGLRPMSAEAFRRMYCYIESGFPIAASFGKHAVSIIGHTWKPDRPPGRNYWHRRFLDSAHFVDGLVVVDDNYFPYQVLTCDAGSPENNYGRTYAKDARENRALCAKDIRSMLCPLPEKAFMPEEDAREMFKTVLDEMAKKSPAIDRHFKQNTVVTRMFITTGTAVKESIVRRLKDPKAGKQQPLCDGEQALFQTVLPHFVWVMELSTVGEYRSLHASGRIVLDATANGREPSVIAGYLKDVLVGIVIAAKEWDLQARKDLRVPAGIFPMLLHNFR